MTPRRRAGRLLGAATVATLAVMVPGVLLGPVSSGPAQASGTQGRVPTPDGSDTPAAPAPKVPVPDVPEQSRADFTRGDGLPEGARVFDSGANSSGVALSDGRLGHGLAEGAAAGFLETRLASDVRSLGVRVRFAGPTSGSVALVAWQDSLVRSRKDFTATPATGMRLVAGPRHWELSKVAGDVKVIAGGDFDAPAGPVTFELLREGSLLYVVDPTGLVTVVEDAHAARLAGPWASWGLTETGPEQTPAAIEAVWAG